MRKMPVGGGREGGTGSARAARVRAALRAAADRNLPIDNYQHLTMGEVRSRLNGCSHKQLEKIRKYESEHKDRKGVREAVDRQLQTD